MFRAARPINILQTHATTLAGTLPSLFEGDVEAVHDARVASRRIRQVLPLTNQWHRANTIDDMAEKFREIGRSLGRVRDADARLEMLSSLESRIPPAAPSLVVLRRHHEHVRQRLMRKLIKGFEDLEVPHILRKVGEGRTRAHRPWVRVGVGWQEQLRRIVKERAIATRESVHHTTGLYFPNRLHRTRIAVKKTRYAVEIASETGVGRAQDDVLRFLKNTQDVLGDLRDRQILVDELSAMEAPAPADIDPEQIRLVIQIVEAEIRELHAKYLRRRPRLLETCHRLESTYSSRRVPIAPVAAAVVVSSAVYLLRGRARVPARLPDASRPLPHEPEMSVRIPIPGAAVTG
jgi:CHAD domain-containing protein